MSVTFGRLFDRRHIDAWFLAAMTVVAIAVFAVVEPSA